MRSIKSWLCIVGALCAIGCGGSNEKTVVDPDLGGLCEPAAEQSNGLRCRYGVDTTCRGAFGEDCQCVCTGYWECDQVKAICDADLGKTD